MHPTSTTGPYGYTQPGQYPPTTANPYATAQAQEQYAQPQQQHYAQPQQQQQQYAQPQMQQQYAQPAQAQYAQPAQAQYAQPQAPPPQQQYQQQAYMPQQPVEQWQPEPAPPALNATDDNGLRWTWAIYPNTAKRKGKDANTTSSGTIPLPEMIIPMSCMYSPLHPLTNPEQYVRSNPRYDGIRCESCGAYLSRHNTREDGRYWVCFACLRHTPMLPRLVAAPQHPVWHHDTVEYIIPSEPIMHQQQAAPQVRSPTFIFMVDVCLAAQELNALLQHIRQALPTLPPSSLVGLITVGSHACVWEVGQGAGLIKNYVLRGGDAAITGSGGDVCKQRAAMAKALQVGANKPVRGSFLAPLQDCAEKLDAILAEVTADDGARPSTERPLRMTGMAVLIATFLAESVALTPTQMAVSATTSSTAGNKTGATPNTSPLPPTCEEFSRLLLFTGGPCTRGPGAVVGIDKAEMMRFHRDLMENNAPYVPEASKFYQELEVRLAAINSSLDVFAQSFDQVGVMEMRACVNHTGGTFICGDDFSHDIFAQSLRMYFERCGLQGGGGGGGGDEVVVRCGFAVHMEIFCTNDTLVSGVLGPCSVDAAANQRAKPHRTSPLQIGVGGTNRWCAGSVDEHVTFGVIFDTAVMEDESDKKNAADDGGVRAPAPPHASSRHQQHRIIQFVVRFITPSGEQRVRVSTIQQPIAQPGVSTMYYINHQTFDQTCASTIIARMAVSVLERFPNKWDATRRWLDTMLVQFVKTYGTFVLNMPDSLKMAPCISLFPSFMFNLRRSEYFMVLNISPDETTVKRHWLMREPVDTCVLMIQPALYSYDLEVAEATAVPLDSSSLRDDNIVLMDAFFNVHIMWGSTIFEWIKAGYQDLPDYAHFTALLAAVEADAEGVVAERYPYPRFSRTDANGSEARHVKNRVNPATTHNANPTSSTLYNAAGGFNQAGAVCDVPQTADLIYTDDVSIARFVQSLKQAVTTYNPDGAKSKSVVAGALAR